MSVRPASWRDGWWKDFDWTIAGLASALCAIGLIQVYSSTVGTRFQGAFGQHAVWLVLGLALFLLASFVDYSRLVSLSPGFWLVGIVLLLVVLLFTDPVNGSRRWLSTPFGFSVQVSEYMKVVLILVLANHFRRHTAKTWQLRNLAAVGVLFLAPFLLVVMQPDLGTALSMAPLLGMALFLSTIRLKHIVGVCLVGLLLVPLAWANLKPYQRDRITGFLNPEAAPRSIGYQTLQSKIAVGSGGLWGQGFTQGSQTRLHFLPTPHTDFILASFAEERGFLGVSFVLGLYLALILRIAASGRSAADPEGTLIAMGVAALLLFQVVVNAGMVAGKLPVTGLPLPLMSYGGSSLVTFMTMLGLVNSVRRSRFVN